MIEEVGRLRFRGRFKAGTDRDHLRFVSDNDSRETIETWEACFAEGVRQEEVTKVLPPAVQKLHEDSLTKDRDVLATVPEEERRKWLARDGTDWTGAFGQDPAAIMTGRDSRDETEYETDATSEDMPDTPDIPDTTDEATPMPLPTNPIASAELLHRKTDLGIQDATTASPRASDDMPDRPSTSTSSMASQSTTESGRSRTSRNPITQYKEYRDRSRDLHRQHRGLMQWRPLRNAQFAKDEAKFAVRRVTRMGALSGRQPDVETEV